MVNRDDYFLQRLTVKEKELYLVKKMRYGINLSIERTIKLPPSMMPQNWMGTDFANDLVQNLLTTTIRTITVEIVNVLIEGLLSFPNEDVYGMGKTCYVVDKKITC